MMMMVQPGRIFARSVEEAVMALRERYGDGKLVIYPTHTQYRKGWVWFEFYIEILDMKEKPSFCRSIGEYRLKGREKHE